MKISIIGFGNVGSHLVNAFKSSSIDVTHVLTNQKIEKSNFHVIRDIDSLPKNQLALICIPDNNINEITSNIPLDIPVAYTSGSIKLESLNRKENIGVFYPLQTFTKNQDLDYNSIPFFIESNNEDFGRELFKLAQELSNQVNYANSSQRAKMHQVAVWVNNFVNHILFQAQEKAKQENVDFKFMIPLLEETIKKALSIGAFEAQTGPARRMDKEIIENQASQLNGSQEDIYRAISQSILNTYHDEEL